MRLLSLVSKLFILFTELPRFFFIRETTHPTRYPEAYIFDWCRGDMKQKILNNKSVWILYKKWKNWHPVIDFKLWYKKRNERCSYCAWYLHPQFRHKTHRPMTMVPCMDKDGKMICSNCATNPNSNY